MYLIKWNDYTVEVPVKKQVRSAIEKMVLESEGSSSSHARVVASRLIKSREIKVYQRVYVYGTLRDSHMWKALGVETYSDLGLKEDILRGYQLKVSDGVPYPWIMPSSSKSAFVKVFPFWVNINDMARLDRYEGYPSLYSRVVVTVDSGAKGHIYTAKSKILTKRNDMETVVTGDWAEYLNRRR